MTPKYVEMHFTPDEFNYLLLVLRMRAKMTMPETPLVNAVVEGILERFEAVNTRLVFVVENATRPKPETSTGAPFVTVENQMGAWVAVLYMIVAGDQGKPVYASCRAGMKWRHKADAETEGRMWCEQEHVEYRETLQ